MYLNRLFWCFCSQRYLALAKDSHGFGEEQALAFLHFHKYDLRCATEDLKNYTHCPTQWSVEDQIAFSEAFSYAGKNFNSIQKLVSWRCSILLESLLFSDFNISAATFWFSNFSDASQDIGRSRYLLLQMEEKSEYCFDCHGKAPQGPRSYPVTFDQPVSPFTKSPIPLVQCSLSHVLSRNGSLLTRPSDCRSGADNGSDGRSSDSDCDYPRVRLRQRYNKRRGGNNSRFRNSDSANRKGSKRSGASSVASDSNQAGSSRSRLRPPRNFHLNVEEYRNFVSVPQSDTENAIRNLINETKETRAQLQQLKQVSSGNVFLLVSIEPLEVIRG